MELFEKKSELNNRRIEWLDALKGLAILLVLIGHHSPPFVKYIYGFHMPLFFLISGYLYKESDNVPKHIWHIIKRYIFSYVALCLVNLVIYYGEIYLVVENYQIDWRKILSDIKGILIIRESSMQGCYALWFLPVLASAQIIFILLMSIKRRWIRHLITLAGVCAGFVLGYLRIQTPFRISVAMVGVLFISIGYYSKKHDVIDRINREISMIYRFLIIIALSVIGYFAIRINRPGSKVDMSSATYGRVYLFIIGAVAWSYVCFLLASSLYGVFRFNVIYLILEKIGAHTMFIMAFDESSSNTGGLILDSYKINHIWYRDLAFRSVILFVYFVIYRILRTIVLFAYKKIKCIANKE